MSDAGMTSAEVQAFRAALLREMNPNHLFGFASALAPDHCTSASLLHARGMLLEKKRMLGALTVDRCLSGLRSLALHAWPPRTAPQVLADARRELDTLARSLRVPPALLYRKARQTAGEMVVDTFATFADVPHAVVAIARPLVLDLGPVRVLDPQAVRLALPPATHLSTPSDLEERARWVRHYAREAARARA